MVADNRTITIKKEVGDDKVILYKISKSNTRSVTIEWLTRTEAEDLHAQLESILYKEGKKP